MILTKKKNLPELRQIFLAKPFNHLFLIHEHRRQNKLHQTFKKYTSQGFHKKYSISIFPKLLTNYIVFYNLTTCWLQDVFALHLVIRSNHLPFCAG